MTFEQTQTEQGSSTPESTAPLSYRDSLNRIGAVAILPETNTGAEQAEIAARLKARREAIDASLAVDGDSLAAAHRTVALEGDPTVVPVSAITTPEERAERAEQRRIKEQAHLDHQAEIVARSDNLKDLIVGPDAAYGSRLRFGGKTVVDEPLRELTPVDPNTSTKDLRGPAERRRDEAVARQAELDAMNRNDSSYSE